MCRRMITQWHAGEEDLNERISLFHGYNESKQINSLLNLVRANLVLNNIFAQIDHLTKHIMHIYSKRVTYSNSCL